MRCASTNWFPSFTKFANHLMMATKFGVYFLKYQIHLTKYGTKVFTTNFHYKLRQKGIPSKLLNTLSDFLDNRTQRVILNGHYSSWAKVEAGDSQGSILGSPLFLIYINDLSENLASNPKLFAVNTSLFSVVKSVDASNIDLNTL